MDLITLVPGLASLFIAGANVMIFCIIKFNDMRHMQESLDRIERNQTMIWEKLDATTEKVCKLEGKIESLETKK